MIIYAVNRKTVSSRTFDKYGQIMDWRAPFVRVRFSNFCRNNNWRNKGLDLWSGLSLLKSCTRGKRLEESDVKNVKDWRALQIRKVLLAEKNVWRVAGRRSDIVHRCCNSDVKSTRKMLTMSKNLFRFVRFVLSWVKRREKVIKLWKRTLKLCLSFHLGMSSYLTKSFSYWSALYQIWKTGDAQLNIDWAYLMHRFA